MTVSFFRIVSAETATQRYCCIKSNDLMDYSMAQHNVTLKQLRAFVCVAEQGSFVAAAQVLALSQPALSQCIRQFEEQIGGDLFHRTTRSVMLTAVGLDFLPTAKELVRQVDTAINDLQGKATRKEGRVIVACLPSIAYRMIPQVIAAHEVTNPGVRIIVRDINAEAIETAIVDGTADIGIGSFPASSRWMEGLILARDRFFAVMPRTHPLARKAEITWRELDGAPFVAMTADTGIRGLVESAAAPLGIHLAIVSEVSNLTTVYGLLQEGLGVTALPGLALPPDNHPFLVARPLKSPKIERTIRIVWRHGVGPSPAARAFVESITTAFRNARVLKDGSRVEWPDRGTPLKQRRRK
jgi:DNA-binding transcriptional LysR family regulator